MHGERKRLKVHVPVVGIGWAVLVIVIAALFVYFSWNMVMPDFLGAEKMNFKNVLGPVILMAMTGWILIHGYVGLASWGLRLRK